MNIVFLEPLGMDGCTLRKRTAPLEQAGHQVTLYMNRTENEEELIRRAQKAEIVVVSNIPLKKHFFDHCPQLRFLDVAFTGLDHIDLEECRKRGIQVVNAAGYSTEAVAELAIGMMIAVYRKIVSGDAVVRAGGDRQNFLGTELRGKTVGIIGTGAIGQQVAKLAYAFGCRIIAYNRTPRQLEHVQMVDKETLLRQADIITLHIPYTPETKGFIGEKELAAMSAHAILINTARGPVVDQNALYNALCKEQIAGAAVDVYDQEPPLPADFQLFNAPHLLMLPHLGYATQEAFGIRLDIVIQNIKNWFQQNQ